MVQKRPFAGEEPYDVSSKHPRQLEYSNQLVSFLDFVPAEDTAQPPNLLGEGKGHFAKGDEKHAGGWGEDDRPEEAPFHLLFSPEYYNSGWPVRTLVHSEGSYTSLLEGRPRKLVPVGPDFQADVPEWDAHGIKKDYDGSYEPEPLILSQQPSEFHLNDHNDDENKLVGTCVIPMPELGLVAYNGDMAGDGRTDCCCEDSGSVGCVNWHIKEEREKLWRVFGPETFSELGFSDMGEVVSGTWSLEEEQLFQEVVFSSPASLGKNFWDLLSMAFPSRTKREIVSYYFNVFMLRKRAEQNRCDPMNVDSDDDEWQGSDDSGIDEFQLGRDESDHNEIHGDDSHEDDDSLELDIGMANGGSHAFMFEPCDAKVWDHVGYLTCPKNELEFLPTCSMIEEVFGVGAWNYKAGDGDGLS
ncbi:hypothetical protein U1Q18_027610 [Sarracenia purpurea var. burkii]